MVRKLESPNPEFGKLAKLQPPAVSAPPATLQAWLKICGRLANSPLAITRGSVGPGTSEGGSVTPSDEVGSSLRTRAATGRAVVQARVAATRPIVALRTTANLCEQRNIRATPQRHSNP